MAKYTPEEIDDVIDQFKSLMSQFSEAEDAHNRGEWHKKYDERFGKYNDKLRRFKSDDYDVVEDAYDEFKDLHSKEPTFDDETYADKLEENIKSFIEKVWPEAPEEVKEEVAETVAEKASDGEEGKVEAHIEAEEGDSEPEVHVVEEKTEEKPEEKEVEAEDDETTSDARTKRINKMKSSWTGSPHTSGGRDGTVSDENCKEEPSEAPAYDRLDAEEKSEDEKDLDDLNKAYDRLKGDPLYKLSH